MTKTGNIYKLEQHRLVTGDALNQDHVDKLIDDLEIDLILTDPPYGVNYTRSKKDFQEISKDKEIEGDHIQDDSEYRQFTQNWIEKVVPHLADKNSIYIFNSDKMIFALRDGMLNAKCKLSQLLVWVKSHNTLARKDYLPKHELIAYGWHDRHEFKKSKDKSVIFCPKPNKSKLHPTMKPPSLLRRLILNSTNINDVIYDPFLGSGSTLVACEHTKRKCLSIEIDPEYCQTTIDRWEKLTGEKAKKL